MTGIYPGGFTYVRFWTKIEFSNVLYHGKQSQNNCEMQLKISRCCKLRSRFMAGPW